MSKIQKTQKQTEELNSSQIKEILVRFGQTLQSIESLYAEGFSTSFDVHVALATLFNETSREITDTCSMLGYTEPVKNVLSVDDFFVQSGVIGTDESQTETQVNVSFDDQECVDNESKSMVPSLYAPTTSVNSDIGQFLQRPVLIHTTNWTLGANVDTSIRPWHLFFDHTSIKKKIDNYAFVRCDLHIKVMINASPFYYSALMLSYLPVSSYNSASVSTTLGDPLVGYSQRPHIMVYPQTNEGGEMTLPFVYPYEWLKLTSSSDLQNMGIMFLDSFDILRTASAATGTSIDVQVYAWAENVVLSGLTVDLAVQSKDEYGKGCVSKPASAIARATGLLGSVPVIGTFMTATSIAADTVSNIASLFGYTKVPVIEDVKPYKNLPFHGLATAEISDCTERLCVDSKNELTVNNSSIGAESEDPLLISNFVQKTSYLTNFTWASSDVAGTLIWNSYVTPYMSSTTAGTGQTIVNGTPIWLVANMFDYWRGDIIFDLKILCSQYHRGRLRISWDPVGNIGNVTDSSTEVYTSIVDITENTNVSITVPYCQRTAYQKIPTDPTSTIYNTVSLSKDTSDTVNGILTVRVLNEQTSPVTSSDITVLVSVRGSENLEFASPKEINEDLSHFVVQSGLQTTQQISFGGHSTVDDNINLIYMGEKIVNLRSLLMRCNQEFVQLNDTALSWSTYDVMTMARRPLYRGFDPDGIHSANEIVGASTASYNFVNFTPYNLLSPCFLGERGSFTWKIDFDGYLPASFLISRPKTNLTSAAYTYSGTQLSALSSNGLSALFSQNDSTNSGALLINQRTNTGISFNAPQYSIISFLDTAPSSRTEGLSNVSGDDAIRSTYIQKESTHSDADQVYHRFLYQVGPDYSPVFFLNVPTMYVYNSTPTGA